MDSLRAQFQSLYWAYNSKRYRASYGAVKAFACGLVKQALRANGGKFETRNPTGYAFIRYLCDEVHDPVHLYVINSWMSYELVQTPQLAFNPGHF